MMFYYYPLLFEKVAISPRQSYLWTMVTENPQQQISDFFSDFISFD